MALGDFLQSIGISFLKSPAVRPSNFNAILNKSTARTGPKWSREVVLRSQAQAEYNDDNIGHFGLNLRRYAHFTSPIRRYSDLVVHRALISALKLGDDGWRPEDLEKFSEFGESLSQCRAPRGRRRAGCAGPLSGRLSGRTHGFRVHRPDFRRHPLRPVSSRSTRPARTVWCPFAACATTIIATTRKNIPWLATAQGIFIG